MDHKTLIKMKFVLNKECAWVAREKMRVHIEKEYEEEQEQPAGGDDEFVDMFATPPTVFSSEDVGTISWWSRMEGRLEHIEGEVHHIREDVRDIKDMMANLLSWYPPP